MPEMQDEDEDEIVTSGILPISETEKPVKKRLKRRFFTGL